ncbi:hypothetical protein [Aquimarina latercula]|uniref:hypothetical protein n=1 Tax=Aquimarina latercula TaxID=987 RepID=UPI000409A0BF|nr:hypothetical protein [Aquimarina latercula]
MGKNKNNRDNILKRLGNRYSLSDKSLNNFTLPFNEYQKLEGKIKDEIIDELIIIDSKESKSDFLKSIKKMF